jgi:hypothetical protein
MDKGIYEGEQVNIVHRRKSDYSIDPFTAKKSIAEYEYVYENWYCKSCEQINETPVSFDIYFRRVPVNEMKELKGWLAEGRTP